MFNFSKVFLKKAKGGFSQSPEVSGSATDRLGAHFVLYNVHQSCSIESNAAPSAMSIPSAIFGSTRDPCTGLVASGRDLTDQTQVYKSTTFDPLFNLATEDWIFNDGDLSKQTLFLWRNAPTVSELVVCF